MAAEKNTVTPVNSSDNAPFDIHRALGYIGISKKAGMCIIGTPAVCDALRSLKSRDNTRVTESKQERNTGRNTGRYKDECAVFCAGDASAATKNKLRDKCAFYGVRISELDGVMSTELAHRVGKTGAVAAIMITNAGIADAALAALKTNTPE